MFPNRCGKARQDSPPPPACREALRPIAKSLSKREIAVRLAVTEGRVKTHVIGVLSKLGVNGRAAAVTTAIQRDIIFRIAPAK